MGEAKRRARRPAEIPAPRYVLDDPYFMRLADASAGMPLDRAMKALMNHLAHCIGMATDDLGMAEAVARQTGEDLARTIRDNWQELSDGRVLMRSDTRGSA